MQMAGPGDPPADRPLTCLPAWETEDPSTPTGQKQGCNPQAIFPSVTWQPTGEDTGLTGPGSVT